MKYIPFKPETTVKEINEIIKEHRLLYAPILSIDKNGNESFKESIPVGYCVI